jgi:thymidylate kinase
MKTKRWDSRHGQILSAICSRFEDEGIRYFILRNYEGLPEINLSKDVDIVIEQKNILKAKKILKQVYIENKIKYYHEVQYGYVYCCHGMNIETNMAIHIDIIGSYVSKGSELFTFDEMYAHTENYNNFRVLNKYFEGVMVFIYKQFNYKPILNDEYKNIIYNTHKSYPDFQILIADLVGTELTSKIFIEIEQKNFDNMLKYSDQLTKALRKYAFKMHPIKTIKYTIEFYIKKIDRLIFRYNKFAKVFSIMAPDGAGKTTFLDALIDKIDFYYVSDKSDNRCHVYHFRPRLLPNLGALGKKTGVKQPDEDFTNPHRAKPASTLSSLVRISYYWLDYVIGYSYSVRKDVQYDRFSVFDRYSYDFIVDPGRTRLNLPLWIRKLYVKCMHHPKIVFYLRADPEVIYKRKQELTLDEIKRQTIEYKKVAASSPRFVTLDANRSANESVDEALKIILDTFTEKL